MRIPFNKPFATGRELTYIAQAIESGHLSGDGPFSRRCQQWLERTLDSPAALLTHSCTAALEMAAILCELNPGDEVIMPSFTFPSTANAVVLRGAVPVFVDIRPDTQNLDESLVEAAIGPRTRAIFVVHYAGVACEMDEILAVAGRHRLLVVEDAAQAVLSRYKGRCLGAIGDMGALSFHETKNLISGEGGAILVNVERFWERAEVVREKGTNRARFFRGEIAKYNWIDIGSSLLPGEIVSAYLLAQLEVAEALTKRRIDIWRRYHDGFEALERAGDLRRPVVPDTCQHNGFGYYVMLPDSESRGRLLRGLNELGIHATFHYVPLHSAPAGLRFGRTCGSLPATERAGHCLLRLPHWLGVEPQVDEVIEAVSALLRR